MDDLNVMGFTRQQMQFLAEEIIFPESCYPCSFDVDNFSDLDVHIRKAVRMLAAEQTNAEAIACLSHWTYVYKYLNKRRKLNSSISEKSPNFDVESSRVLPEATEEASYSRSYWPMAMARRLTYATQSSVQRLTNAIVRPFRSDLNVHKMFVSSLDDFAKYDVICIRIAAKISGIPLEIEKQTTNSDDDSDDDALPLLIMPNKDFLSGYVAILFAVSNVKLSGKTIVEKAKILEWIVNAYKLDRFAVEGLNTFIKKMKSALSSHEEKYLVGRSLTLADIVVAMKIYEEIPYCKRKNDTKLKKWLASILSLKEFKLFLGQIVE